jgi:hypothetical protein
MDPPPGLIAVPVPKAVLLLTEAVYLRGIQRGKWWKRRAAVTAQTPRAPRGPDARGGGHVLRDLGCNRDHQAEPTGLS